MLKETLPLGRVKLKDLDAAGVVRLPRTIAVRDGVPVMEDGQVVDAANVVWCTGYRPAFDWVRLDAFDEEGQPLHDRGVVATEPGLYFIGLFFLSTLASSLVGGVGRDAEYIARHITARVARLRQTQPASA
jgi:putative flavoprotein involved in K+ transport